MATQLSVFLLFLSSCFFVHTWIIERGYNPIDMCPTAQCNPTILEDRYDLGYSVQTLYKGNKDTITNVMSKLTLRQRLEVAAKFKHDYKKDIDKAIGLGGFSLRKQYARAYDALINPPEHTFAKHLHRAIQYQNYDDITEILFTISNLGVVATVHSYGNQFKSILKDIKYYLKEPILRDLIERRVLYEKLEALVDYDDHVAKIQAREICAELVKPDYGGWEIVLNSYLVTESFEQMLTLFDNLLVCSGQKSMHDFIHKYTKKTTVRKVYSDLVAVIYDPYTYLARKLKKALSGLGTDDNDLIRIVIARSEIDLFDVENAYNRLPEVTQKHGSLMRDISDDTSRSYGRLLANIITRRVIA